MAHANQYGFGNWEGCGWELVVDVAPEKGDVEKH